MAAKDEALSRAIKILMNSFYGVLGTPGCRFFDARLPTSITRRGHAVIERARAFFVGEGLRVLYGDTDSLFVHVPDGAAADRGRVLAADLTRALSAEIARDFRVVSRLELRFESHYVRFLMPTMRGSERGSKKRYAGLVRRAEYAGAPPHVRAARMREGDAQSASEVEYVVTTRGPEPSDQRRSPIDHAHYLEKQLAPACDVVLPFLGTTFAKIAGTQRSLF
jgi:DNA polymerase elongation subunit (family B)